MNKKQWVRRAELLQEFKEQLYSFTWPDSMKEEFDQVTYKLDDLENLCWAEAEELEKKEQSA